MHGHMNWGNYPHTRFSRAGMEMDVPLIPAPVAGVALICGLIVGVLIGYKKAQIHAVASTMGGTGHGMMGGGMTAGHGFDGHWMKRKKAMMSAMAAHHHHQTGSGPCWCGAQGESAEVPENAEKEATGGK